jgi:hypothetical protein
LLGSGVLVASVGATVGVRRERPRQGKGGYSVKRCSECGQEMRLAHGIWSHAQQSACKIRFIRATEAERAAERSTALPLRRRTWADESAAQPEGRFGYLAARPEPTGPSP